MITEKNRSAVQAAVFLLPMIVPIAAYVAGRLFGSMPLLPWQMRFVAMALLLLGLAVLVKAKFRMIKSLKISFGPSELLDTERRLYFIAYTIFAVAVGLAIFTE